MNKRLATGWVILGLALLAGMPVHAQVPADADSLSGAETVAATDAAPPDFLILPVVNYAERGEARSLLAPRLYRNLERLGVTFLTSEELRPLLRRHRIRSRGWVGLEGARILRRETRARYLILGSWDVFRDGDNPEIGLSLRILDLEHMALLSAVSVGLTGADFTRALGLGRVTSIVELADLAMARAVDGLFPLPSYVDPRLSYRGCFQMALVPFDNYSGTPNAGDIVTNVVLSRLLAQGYSVVEPGFVRELGLALEVVNRGGVDSDSARSILDRFGACRVVTGSVETFAVAQGSPTRSVPAMALGIRVMSPLDGNLYMMEEIQGRGDDGDGMFQGGRIHALVTLTDKVIKAFLDDVSANNREDILYGNRNP